MAVFVRAKRVTDLDEKVKARLRGDDGHRATGYASSRSSGSEHEADACCLSGLVHAFLERDDSSDPASGVASDAGAESDDDEASGPAASAAEIVRDLMDPPARADLFRARLAAEVATATEAVGGMRSAGPAFFRRAVMAGLRAAGYNAGICKARWETSSGVSAGRYEYIDVVSAAGGSEGRRYIVDLEFAAEFEIARATAEYGAVVAALPRVAVARPEAVRQAVRVVAEEARRSLRSSGLHVPPWRKSRFMLAKWIGPYRRTTSPLPSASDSVGPSGDVRCRAVGFLAAAAGRLVPSATRTR